MWTHLIKVPLVIRAAGHLDIPALLHLQDVSISPKRVCCAITQMHWHLLEGSQPRCPACNLAASADLPYQKCMEEMHESVLAPFYV